MHFKKIIFSFFLSICLLSIANAQRAEIGVNAGGSGYIGDLNQFNPLKISGINVGAFAKINFDPHWGLGLHINYGEISAEDALSKSAEFRQRNLNFKTSLNEISFIGSFNFIDMYSPGSRKRVTPYLFAGAGGVIFNPNFIYKSSDGTKTTYPIESPSEGFDYRKYAIVIPFGAGLKYKKSENWTLFGQIGYRTAFTDHIDDVSNIYPESSVFNSGINTSDRSIGEIYHPGDQRGDFRKRDTYLFVNIGISYTFVSQKCFTF